MEDLGSYLKLFLSVPRKIVILGHARPDGDALGSTVALATYYRKLGHDAQVIVPNDYAEFLKWLPNLDLVTDNQREGSKATALLDEAELVFCLDFNDPARLEYLSGKFKHSRAMRIMIDHHKNPQDFTRYRYWDDNASSTAELIYRFIEEFGDIKLIDKDIATCLYTGVLTDTGSFRYSNTSSQTLRIVADLMEFDLDTAQIYDRVYNTFSQDRLRFFGYCFSEKMKVFPELQSAVIWVSEDELNRFNVRPGDTEGLVNFPLTIKGIIFACLIVDRSSQIKLSFRSKGDFNVEQFAKSHFQGGGHFNASGGASQQSLDETLQRFIDLLPETKGLALAAES
jgi:phosphoesterase RecJ-like protein